MTFERHRFFTCTQKSGETIDQYVTELRSRSKTCEFNELTESLIKDRIVCGIPDNGLRERLLREQDPDLDKAIALCRAAETVKSQAKEQVSDGTCAVDAVNKQDAHRSKHKGSYVKKSEGVVRNKNETDSEESMWSLWNTTSSQEMPCIWEIVQ